MKRLINNKEVKKERIKFSPSGTTLMDLSIKKGLPFGRIITLAGDYSTGKSFLASDFIAAGRKKYGKNFRWFYDDVEAGHNFSENLFGFSLIPSDQESSSTLEHFITNIKDKVKKLKKGQKFIYVLDSLDALPTKKEREGFDEEKDSSSGYNLDKQKKLSAFFRVISDIIAQKNFILVIVSQLRENIGGGLFSPKYKKSGGKAPDYYSSVTFWLYKSEVLLKKNKAVGVSIKVKNTKNKIGPPFRDVFLNLFFEYGIDNISSNIDYLFGLKSSNGKISKKKSEKIKWEGKNFKREELILFVEDNNQEDLLEKKVKERWEREEKESSTQRKSKYE